MVYVKFKLLDEMEEQLRERGWGRGVSKRALLINEPFSSAQMQGGLYTSESPKLRYDGMRALFSYPRALAVL